MNGAYLTLDFLEERGAHVFDRINFENRHPRGAYLDKVVKKALENNGGRFLAFLLAQPDLCNDLVDMCVDPSVGDNFAIKIAAKKGYFDSFCVLYQAGCADGIEDNLFCTATYLDALDDSIRRSTSPGPRPYLKRILGKRSIVNLLRPKVDSDNFFAETKHLYSSE